ncbi:EamA/RhaT family transporter [Stutzerimonas kirkiae]|uniref:EamA/RhaT family transporter n=1 Tax=Stutzerimonas kirkiae TaxID=2211392 RepID=A0A4Q9RCP4_9GAMM|nr:DMT family transporter [Stutzerimonas kirkiae]TBU98884.1 EamA/RhaT family transporter [Stutzerimonas kirkiae]TBV03978.1 EamA/RhaT family transporter [Stutzerimonas kirkiae]TBV16856.1 EamA/RhaT family transporter [Stutzerimonas kirkiae]
MANRHTSLWLPLLLLVSTGGLMGLTNNLVKQAVASGWQPLSFLMLSLLGSGLLLALLAVARGEYPGLRKQHFRYYLVAALLSASLPHSLLFSAVTHTGAGFASICLAFPPLFTYLMALSLNMERLRPLRLAGLLLGLLGAVLLTLDKFAGANPSPWALALLCTPVLLALGNIYRTRHWPAGASPLSLAPGMLLAAALQLLPVVLLGGAPWLPEQGGRAVPAQLAAQTALFALTYALFFLLQRIAGPVYLSQVGAVAAIAGTAIAVGLLGESASPAMLLALLAVIGGVLLVSLNPPTPGDRHGN